MTPQAIGPNIWLVDGPEIVAAAGFHYPTRMVVVRLSGGGLWLWSPVAPTERLLTWLDGLGPVMALVAPNALHHMSMAAWQARYPQAVLAAPARLRAKRPDLTIARDLPDAGLWPEDFSQLLLPNSIAPEIVFFHHASGTVLFCDLLQQMPPDWFTGWRRIVAHLDLMTAPEPMVPRKFRLALRPRGPVRQAIDTLLGWPVRQVVMAHGPLVSKDAPGFLLRAFAWLKR